MVSARQRSLPPRPLATSTSPADQAVVTGRAGQPVAAATAPDAGRVAVDHDGVGAVVPSHPGVIPDDHEVLDALGEDRAEQSQGSEVDVEAPAAVLRTQVRHERQIPAAASHHPAAGLEEVAACDIHDIVTGSHVGLHDRARDVHLQPLVGGRTPEGDLHGGEVGRGQIEARDVTCPGHDGPSVGGHAPQPVVDRQVGQPDLGGRHRQRAVAVPEAHVTGRSLDALVDHEVLLAGRVPCDDHVVVDRGVLPGADFSAAVAGLDEVAALIHLRAVAGHVVERSGVHGVEAVTSGQRVVTVAQDADDLAGRTGQRAHREDGPQSGRGRECLHGGLEAPYGGLVRQLGHVTSIRLWPRAREVAGNRRRIGVAPSPSGRSPSRSRRRCRRGPRAR